MNRPDKQFVTYPIALDLNELGFDEECFGYFNPDNELVYGIDVKMIKYVHKYHKEDESVLAPLWQQAIDFLMQELDKFDEYFELELRYFSDYSGGIYNLDVEILDFDDREMLVESLLQLLKEKLNK